MKRMTIAMGQEPIARSPVAKAMWGRVKAQTFADRRTKAPKHKARWKEGW